MIAYKGEKFNFKVYTREIDSERFIRTVDSIIVCGKNGRSIQVIHPPDNSYDGAPMNHDPLNVEDINYDGHDDIYILQGRPVTANIGYYFWLYVPTKRKFVYNKDLEKISSPEFDASKKVITSYWRGSALTHGIDTYQFINGKLTLTTQVLESSDPHGANYLIVVTKKLIKGKLKIVSKSKKELQ